MALKKTAKGGPGKALRYMKQHGPAEFAAHAAELVRDRRFDYQKWILRQRITSVQAGYQRKLKMKLMPGVYVFAADSSCRSEQTSSLLSETVRSVKASTYPKTYMVQAMNSHISDDDFITFVRPGSVIERNAIFEMVRAVQSGADAVYTDSDFYVKTAGGPVYSDPLFKPDYNPCYLMSAYYIGCLFMVRAGIVRQLYSGGRNDLIPSSSKLSDPAYCYGLTLRCSYLASEQGGCAHVSRVLYHELKNEADAWKADETLFCRMKASLEKELEARSLPASAEDGPLPGTFHVAYDIAEENGKKPLVSIVIPNKDNASVLENCIASIRRRSSYGNYEIVVVENNSHDERTFELYRQLEEKNEARVVRYNHSFHFSRVVNEGVRRANGSYIVLMNNDVTVKTPDWIELLLAQVQRPENGCAGPKLLYPDGRVQSAGIVTGIMGYAGSMMVGERGDDPGYMGRACLTQNMSAVTAACMMVKREAFVKAGGYPDEFAVALGDVDFCLSLADAGYRVVFEPAAVMIHHESLTRGAEDTPEKKRRFKKEKARFMRKRAAVLKAGDPSYNPNLSGRRCDWSQQT